MDIFLLRNINGPDVDTPQEEYVQQASWSQLANKYSEDELNQLLDDGGIEEAINETLV